MIVLIIHGIGGHAGMHWQQWLKGMVEQAGHKVLMLNMPDAQQPDRAQWLNTVSSLVADEDLSQLIVVGHSLGVTTALDFIEQVNHPIAGLVSVSGFASDYGADLNGYFLKEKLIDFDRVRTNVKKISVIYGDNDPYVTQEALKEVADKLGTQAVVIPSGGHLNTESGYTEFPELIDMVVA